MEQKTELNSLHPYLTEGGYSLIMNPDALVLFNVFMGKVFFGKGPELTELRKYWDPLAAFDLYSRLCFAHIDGELSDGSYAVVNAWMDAFRVPDEDRTAVFSCFGAMGGYSDSEVLSYVMIGPMITCRECGQGVCPCCEEHTSGCECGEERDIGMLN